MFTVLSISFTAVCQGADLQLSDNQGCIVNRNAWQCIVQNLYFEFFLQDPQEDAFELVITRVMSRVEMTCIRKPPARSSPLTQNSPEFREAVEETVKLKD